MIYFSLHQGKNFGYAYYNTMSASIFISNIFNDVRKRHENDGAWASLIETKSDFLCEFLVIDIHETLHLLLKKLGQKGYSSEKKIQVLSEKIIETLVDKHFAKELAEILEW